MYLYYTMNTTAKITKKSRRKQSTMGGIYSKMLITRTVPVSITNVGGNLKNTLQQVIASMIEGRCVVDGYVKPNTTNVISYSSGTIKGDMVNFEVTFECEVSLPVEGMQISCVARNITKAGIRAEADEEPNPIVVFIARDHHNTMPYFSEVVEGDRIDIRVIGQRFELNDKYISVIAELLEPRDGRQNRQTKSNKPKITIKDS